MSALLHKDFEAPSVKVAPKATDMEAIAKIAGRAVTPEDVHCRSMRVCNDQLDRSHERFPESYLKRFRDTIGGKSIMPGHDYKQMPLGRIYAARIETDDDGVKHLNAKFFTDAKDERLLRALDLGILKHVSIGFKAGGLICDLCGKTYFSWSSLFGHAAKAHTRAPEDDSPYCEHEPGEEYEGKLCTVTYANPEKAEAMEVSFVWLGCQPGAQILGAAASLTAMKAAHLSELAAKEPAMPPDPETKAGELPDEIKARLAELDAAKALAADGKLYREWLASEIERLYGACQLAATGAAIVKSLASASAVELKASLAEAQALFDTKFPPSPQSRLLGAGAVDPTAGKERAKHEPFDPFRAARKAWENR